MRLHNKVLLLGSYLHLLTSTEAFLSRQNSRSVSLNGSSTTARFVLQEKLSSEEIHARLQDQLGKLREKDRASKAIAPKVGWFFCVDRCLL